MQICISKYSTGVLVFRASGNVPEPVDTKFNSGPARRYSAGTACAEYLSSRNSRDAYCNTLMRIAIRGLVRGRWALLPISAPCGVRQSLQFRLADSDPQNLLGSGYQSITHSVYIYGDSEPAVLKPRQNLRTLNIRNRGDLKMDVELGSRESPTTIFLSYSINL